MAKRVFYTKEKFRAPKELQTYTVWTIFLLLSLPFIYWLGSTEAPEIPEVEIATSQYRELARPDSLAKRDWSTDIEDILEYQAILNSQIPPGFKIGIQRAANADGCLMVKWVPELVPSSPKVLVPYGASSLWHLTELSINLAQINKKLTTPVEYIFYNYAAECDYEANQFAREEKDQSSIKLFLGNEDVLQKDLILTGSTLTQYPSLVWAEIFKEIYDNEPLEQVYFYNLEREFHRHRSLQNATFLQLWNRQTIENKVSLFRSMSRSLEKIAQNQDFLAENFSSGVWLTNNFALSPWSTRLVWFLLLLFLLSPIMNRVVIQKESPDLVAGLISAIYFSITPLLFSTANLLCDYFGYYGDSAFTTILIVSLILILFQRSIAVSSLSIYINSGSATLVSVIFLCFLSFYNGLSMVFWAFFVFLCSRYRQTTKIFRPLLITAGLAPLVLSIANLNPSMIQESYFSIGGVSRLIITNPVQSTLYILFVGSLLSLVFPSRENKQ